MVVAMSGGVDSSVAAGLLVQEGYQVEGVMLQLWSEPAGCEVDPSGNRCCTPDQLADARRVAGLLNIRLQVWDVAELFRERVVDSFVHSYAAGLTPNPCLDCNQHIRFGYLLDRVRETGADYLATGHYARLRKAGSLYEVLCGTDPSKDQSYVLHMLGQSQLPHLLFPLGGYQKAAVRDMARDMGLPVADKADSQDICFLADGDYRRFLRQVAPSSMRAGPILDGEGNTVGTHGGLPGYTIGQRKGLGISADKPLYVLETDLRRNALVVGPKSAAGRRQLMTLPTRWVAGRPPLAGRPFAAEVRIRYQSRPLPAMVEPLDEGRTMVRFEEPLYDIAPGQAAVFYQQQVCLGGGIIARKEPES